MNISLHISTAHCIRAHSYRVLFALLLCLLSNPGQCDLIAPGHAVVTGFSGAPAPAIIPPGVEPDSLRFIDLTSPSVRIIALPAPQPARAQLLSAAKPFSVTADQVGQVFGVVLDDQVPSNAYVAASSVYGLPIVAVGADGKAIHIHRGQIGARFMAGLWGPEAAGAGPGSVWRIDGVSGAVSLLVNVTHDGAPNSGAALGALAYDGRSKSLYVSDRETGMIQRYTLNGTPLGHYDHGVDGRAAQGLAIIPYQRHPLDIESPSFSPEDQSSWQLAPLERRVFGLAVWGGRLYYAVAEGLQIWSVGLTTAGGFSQDARPELSVAPLVVPSEISQIGFDQAGHLYLAERPATYGAFDLQTLTPAGMGRVLRYQQGDDGRWQTEPQEYAIGFPPPYRNGNGGVAIGDASHCDSFLWATGERLRKSDHPPLAALLSDTGPLWVDGLQGVPIKWTRPANTPPLVSLFIDFDDRFDTESNSGHLGALAIRSSCDPGSRGTGPGQAGNQPGHPKGKHPPPVKCPPNKVVLLGLCCSANDLKAGGTCAKELCGPQQIPVGNGSLCCPTNQAYLDSQGQQACCWSGKLENGSCTPPGGGGTPLKPGCGPQSTEPECCAAGYVWNGTGCCLSQQLTSSGVCCPAGQHPSGPNNALCEKGSVGWDFKIPDFSDEGDDPDDGGFKWKHPSIDLTSQTCCPAGQIPLADGSCCAPERATSAGICCSAGTVPLPNGYCGQQVKSLQGCLGGYIQLPDGNCCANFHARR